jgi:hypothetical protein
MKYLILFMALLCGPLQATVAFVVRNAHSLMPHSKPNRPDSELAGGDEIGGDVGSGGLFLS